jgi:hypothetical protein
VVIWWARNQATGNLIPLDCHPVVVYEPFGTLAGTVLIQKVAQGYMSHFHTCPNRSAFTKKARTRPQQFADDQEIGAK